MAAPAVEVDKWCGLDDLPARAKDGRFDLDVGEGGEVDDWIQVASEVLYNLTRRRWPGEQTITIRPRVLGFGPMIKSDDYAATLARYVERRRGTTLTDDGVSAITLPHYPVTSIETVKIDGDTIAAARYRVDDFRHLVYLPVSGEARSTWPAWQDLDVADTEDGSFSVEYKYGTAPPEGGKRMCAELATELAILASPKLPGESRLAERASSVSRQGITANTIDPTRLFEEGRTGLARVDLWVSAVNHGSKKRRARVHRLGRTSARRPST